MPYGDGVISHEGTELRLQYIPRYLQAADGIRSIQNKETETVFRAGFHRHGHGGNIGVKSHAYILNVKYQSIETFQNFLRGFPGLTIQAVDGNVGPFVLER